MPTEEQIEVGCEVAREAINEMKFNTLISDELLRGMVTAKMIRHVVIRVLTASENVLGSEK